MDFEQNLGRYIGQLHFALTKKLNKLLEESNAGITSDQFRLLTTLWKKDGLTQQQLANTTGRDRAGITRMIDILEDQGLLTRIPDKDDRRINLIYLTKKGKALEKIANQCAQRSLDEMTSDFNEEEKNNLESLLLRAFHNLE